MKIKMKRKLLVGLTVLGLATVLLTSCSKVPQVEIDAANAAIEEAKLAGAEMYVHDNYVALQDSMNAVMVSIEAQKSKFFKNYSTVKEHLSGVSMFAQEVKIQAENRKEELKAEIQNTVAEVSALTETNKQLVTEAPKGKEGTSALLAIKDELSTIEASINEVSTMLANGDYLPALDKANAAKEKATAINTELSEVIAKYKGVKGKK
ncbi:MAG: hypothetical protein R2750_10030 [Bacteroidales bacterium]